MNQKHTPGPWRVDSSKSFYVFACGSLVEQAGVENGPFICNASTRANALIIAAAPELLEAASDLLDGWESMSGTSKAHAGRLTPAIKKVLAAVSTAKGGG